MIMAGTNLYWGRGEHGAARAGRGAAHPGVPQRPGPRLPARRPPASFSRARGDGLRGADVALVIGVPLDFRLGFGAAFGEDTEIVIIDVAEPDARAPRARSRPSSTAALPATLGALRSGPAGGPLAERERWLESLRAIETDAARGRSATSWPTRARRCTRCASTASSAQMLDRDAIVIGDGGDFVSYAGRVVDSYRPGLLAGSRAVRLPGLGPGLRAGGQARPPRAPGRPAARRRRVRLRRAWSSTRSPATASPWSAVMGNNGIWALEKHPMEFLYGYSVAAELRPETRYDQVVEALGGHGELVRDARRAAAGARARVRVGQAGAGQRAHRPERGVPAAGQPGLTLARLPALLPTVRGLVHAPTHVSAPAHPGKTRLPPPGHTRRINENRPRIAAGDFRSRFGPIGTGRGTCLKGPVCVVRTAGGAVSAASPGPMLGAGKA